MLGLGAAVGEEIDARCAGSAAGWFCLELSSSLLLELNI
jgi:hypothetical protein